MPKRGRRRRRDGLGAVTAATSAPAKQFGGTIAPVYEGWWDNADGTKTALFGYYSRNTQEQIEVALGPNNHFEPGEPDRGQPTHFYPRRNPFLFTIQVPKDFGNQEIVWTLTANGQTRKAYASLKTDYLIDKQVISTEIGGDFGRDSWQRNCPD